VRTFNSTIAISTPDGNGGTASAVNLSIAFDSIADAHWRHQGSEKKQTRFDRVDATLPCP
jgi:hypothetical protein